VGKRASDIVTLAVLAGDVGRWVALRLSDGGYDGTVYDTREDALSHQFGANATTAVLIPPDGMTVDEARRVIGYWRALYAAHVRDDPEVNMPLIPLTAPDVARQIKALTQRR
jgi:hypothetical protein